MHIVRLHTQLVIIMTNGPLYYGVPDILNKHYSFSNNIGITGILTLTLSSIGSRE